MTKNRLKKDTHPIKGAKPIGKLIDEWFCTGKIYHMLLHHVISYYIIRNHNLC